MKTWRGFDASSFEWIIPRRGNAPDWWGLRTTEKSSAVRSPGGVKESHFGLNGSNVSKEHINLLQPAVRLSCFIQNDSLLGLSIEIG